MLLGGTMLLGPLLAAPALAQSTTEPTAQTEAEPAASAQNDIVVTGTRAQGRSRLDSVSPSTC